MFSTELAEQLIRMEKKITLNNTLIDEYVWEQRSPIDIRLELSPTEASDYSFLWVINQSAKNTIKFTLHVQEDESNTGLFRIDYNGSHHNPESDNGQLPERFRPYIGHRFVNTTHAHYHIEGYKSLAWALPISEVPEMTVQTLDDDADKSKYVAAVYDFAKIINLSTRIIVNAQLL